MRRLLSLGASVLLGVAAIPAGAEDTAPPSPQGLWVADIPLCAETVVNAADVPDFDGTMRELSIELTPDAGERFARLTAQAVGKSITVWLDGAVLTEPTVREPITGGRLTISGMDDSQIERARDAVTAPCPFGEGDPASTAA